MQKSRSLLLRVKSYKMITFWAWSRSEYNMLCLLPGFLPYCLPSSFNFIFPSPLPHKVMCHEQWIRFVCDLMNSPFHPDMTFMVDWVLNIKNQSICQSCCTHLNHSFLHQSWQEWKMERSNLPPVLVPCLPCSRCQSVSSCHHSPEIMVTSWYLWSS